MPYVWFALICVVWGSSFILMKKALLCFSPFAIGWGRTLGGAAVLALLWWWRSRSRTLTRRDLWPMALVVAGGFVWPYVMQPWLVGRYGSAFVGMTVSFTPLFTVVVSIPILGAWPPPRQLLGVLGAIVFLGLLMLDGWERHIPLCDLGWAATVPLGYALTNTFVRRSLRHADPLELTLGGLAVAGVLLLPPALFASGPSAPTTEDLPLAVASLAVLGVIGTGLATYLFNRMIRDHGPLFAGMVTNLIPVGALIWAWIDHETVTPRQVVSLAGLLTMVTLVQYGAAIPPPAAAETGDNAH